MSIIVDVVLRARILELLSDGLSHNAEQIAESLSMSKDYSHPRGGRRYWLLIGQLDDMADLELICTRAHGVLWYRVNPRWRVS